MNSPSSGTPARDLVTPSVRTSVRTTVAAGFGTAIEWYEYSLYGLASALVIGPLFFPEATGSVGVLAAFATFAVGFFARPFGGIVLGALADRWGRRPVLILSILLVGVATTLMGFLPTYAVIGVWAPLLLVVLRLTQGFGAGAELAGAITVINESAPRRRKGFFSSFAMFSSAVGSVLGTAVFTTASTAMPAEAFLSWGWRIPFLLSGVLTVVGLILRNKMPESPEFKAVKLARAAGEIEEARVNPFSAFGRAFMVSPRNWIASFLVPSGILVTTYVITTFGVVYLIGTVGVPQNLTLFITLTNTLLMMITLVAGGWLVDKIGAKRMMFIGIVGGILWVFPYFLIINSGNVGLIILATTILTAFGYGALASAHTVLLPAFFKPEYRSAGLFSSRELNGSLVAGPAPFIATALAMAMGGQPWLVAVFLVTALLLSLIGVIVGRPWASSEEIAETPALIGYDPRE